MLSLRRCKLRIIIGGLFLAGISACQPLENPPLENSSPSPTVFSIVEPQTRTPESTSTNTDTVTLWLPPAFRPDSGTRGGEILQQRITEFEAAHPGVSVVVRLKAVDGAGGLRDSLAMASAAAPASLPDVVALDQPNLRAAALKGMVTRLDSPGGDETGAGLYPFAASIAGFDGEIYGRPFAADAWVNAALTQDQAGTTWVDVAAQAGRVYLPLADSRAVFIFLEYYAAGGKPINSLTTAGVTAEPLERELIWLLDLWEAGILTPASLQLDSPGATLIRLQQFDDQAMTTFSALEGLSGWTAGSPPTPEGKAFTLATAWSWAIATPDPDRQLLAGELLQWLLAPEFLAEWTRAQGLLPASSRVLDGWPAGMERDLVAGLLENALPYPTEEISATLGPILSNAVRAVLIDGAVPADAARDASRAAARSFIR